MLNLQAIATVAYAIRCTLAPFSLSIQVQPRVPFAGTPLKCATRRQLPTHFIQICPQKQYFKR